MPYFDYTTDIKVLYWRQWFHEEPLTTMDSFHCTKASFQMAKKG